MRASGNLEFTRAIVSPVFNQVFCGWNIAVRTVLVRPNVRLTIVLCISSSSSSMVGPNFVQLRHEFDYISTIPLPKSFK